MSANLSPEAHPEAQDKANSVNTDRLNIPGIQEELNQQKALARAIDRPHSSIPGFRYHLHHHREVSAATTEVRSRRGLLLRSTTRLGGRICLGRCGEKLAIRFGGTVYDHCFGEKFAIHYQKGQFQVVADIYAAELSECHVKILEQFQVRANLVIPLLQ
jgi:GAF domain-containing protein